MNPDQYQYYQIQMPYTQDTYAVRYITTTNAPNGIWAQEYIQVEPATLHWQENPAWVTQYSPIPGYDTGMGKIIKTEKQVLDGWDPDENAKETE